MVLLDEIEKAHPEVWNMLLQIMEEGRLTDNVGRMIDFKNSILIMTTNIGAEQIAGQQEFGIHEVARRSDEATYEGMKNKLKAEMEQQLPAGVPQPCGRHHRLPQPDQGKPEAASSTSSWRRCRSGWRRRT